MSQSNPSATEEYDFVDVSVEQFREYELANGETYRIDNPVALYVKESGSHRVLAEMENGQYESHYIDAEGKRPIRWVVEAGQPFFLSWGAEAAKATPAPAVQPRPGDTISMMESRPRISVTRGLEIDDGAENLGSIELQFKGLDDADNGVYTPDDFVATLRDRLHRVGGEATIRTTSHGFMVEETAINGAAE